MSAYKRHGTKFYTKPLDLRSWWHTVCNGNLILDLEFWMSGVLRSVDQTDFIMKEGHKISDKQNSSLPFDKSLKKDMGFLSKVCWLGTIQMVEENNYWLNLTTRRRRLEICETRCIETSQQTSVWIKSTGQINTLMGLT